MSDREPALSRKARHLALEMCKVGWGREMNRLRADAAQIVVDGFAEFFGENDDSDEVFEQNCSDLLTNLMHLARERALDWNLLIHRAQLHFEAEVEEEDGEQR